MAGQIPVPDGSDLPTTSAKCIMVRCSSTDHTVAHVIALSLSAGSGQASFLAGARLPSLPGWWAMGHWWATKARNANRIISHLSTKSARTLKVLIFAQDCQKLHMEETPTKHHACFLPSAGMQANVTAVVEMSNWVSHLS